MHESTPHVKPVTRPFESGTDPVTTVLLVVAEALDTDPKRIRNPLNDVIDTDGLSLLLRNAGAVDHDDWQLSFEYGGCAVEITGAGTVTANPL